MALEQFPFRELTTAAGIAAAALLIRQIIEFSKGSFFPWLDAANERKGAFILAALLYVAWLVVYGTNLEKDLPAAVAAVYACGIAAIGTNEAVDAAKGVVAKNVVQSVATDPAVANAAAASGVTEGSAATTGTIGTTATTNVVVAGDADASSTDVPSAGSVAADSGAPLEDAPDLDLNVNAGDPLDDDDEEDDDLADPATTGLA
jgi:hypothetical protein